jgi:hypothetical protein
MVLLPQILNLEDGRWMRRRMMFHINVNKSGTAVGLVFGGYHLVWSLLVAAGWGQAILDFAMWMHFIKPVFVTEAFSIGWAAILVIATTAIGYILGTLFATIWNLVHPGD